ncbi:MAG: hypothetical protein M3298_07880 [Thermoproteota archaeon]|nr:hypothetical protein [Thermoproteota archaeon]
MSLSRHKYNTYPRKLFHPQDRAEELDLLINDDDEFAKTKQYLGNLIADALNRFDLHTDQLTELHQQLLDDVPVAAKRFLGSEKSMNASYKFSTYFTWYIAERVNRIDDLKRRQL